MPRVSVILPNYNYARYLKERVRSILSQTAGDFEFIYLDDASKDESDLVMQGFGGDPRLKMRLFNENSGKVYQRWNDGAAMATGDWLWFAGADDTAHPRFLETLLALADAHPSAGLLHCRMMTIDSLGRLIGLKWNAIPELAAHMDKDYFAAGYEDAVRMTEGCFVSSASAALLRRDVFERAGGFDTRLWQAADWALYMAMLQHCDAAFSVQPLVCYREHQKTVSKTTRPLVRTLEDACCLARAYRWISADPRCTPAMREVTLRRVKSRLFEVFALPAPVVPANLRFAVEEIYEIVPDKRLLRLANAPA
jgi:glycosyltransferase involved in cell wall biosynthesis